MYGFRKRCSPAGACLRYIFAQEGPTDTRHSQCPLADGPVPQRFERLPFRFVQDSSAIGAPHPNFYCYDCPDRSANGSNLPRRLLSIWMARLVLISCSRSKQAHTAPPRVCLNRRPCSEAFFLRYCREAIGAHWLFLFLSLWVGRTRMR